MNKKQIEFQFPIKYLNSSKKFPRLIKFNRLSSSDLFKLITYKNFVDSFDIYDKCIEFSPGKFFVLNKNKTIIYSENDNKFNKYDSTSDERLNAFKCALNYSNFAKATDTLKEIDYMKYLNTTSHYLGKLNINKMVIENM